MSVHGDPPGEVTEGDPNRQPTGGPKISGHRAHSPLAQKHPGQTQEGQVHLISQVFQLCAGKLGLLIHCRQKHKMMQPLWKIAGGFPRITI